MRKQQTKTHAAPARKYSMRLVMLGVCLCGCVCVYVRVCARVESFGYLVSPHAWWI